MREAEFRGTDNLWVVPVTKDDATGYTFGTPVNLTPTGQISKTVSSSSETHYYSNVGMITIVTKEGRRHRRYNYSCTGTGQDRTAYRDRPTTRPLAHW